MPAVEPWPPQPPDTTLDQISPQCERPPFKFTGHSEVFKLRKSRLAYKDRATQREFQMMLLAGDCSVKVNGRVLFKDHSGLVLLGGILMDLETPLECKDVDVSHREILMQHMVSCIRTLHSTYGVIHGDVKPSNMLICSDGKIRLCDFAEARKADEDPTDWEGITTINYISPNRCHFYPDGHIPPPTIEDDLYGLGLSIWELYTGTVPFDGFYEDDIVDILRTGATVDVDLVQEPDVQEIIRFFIRQGGARV